MAPDRTTSRPPRIAVIGTSRADARERERARAVGVGIADAGCVLVCGGLGGVMAAASEGASSRGGLVLGVLPGDRAADANPYVTVPIPTGLGEARNAVIVHTADVLIAIGGGHGTLSEIAFALRVGKPVFGIDTWDVDPGVTACTSVEDALFRALRAVERT